MVFSRSSGVTDPAELSRAFAANARAILSTAIIYTPVVIRQNTVTEPPPTAARLNLNLPIPSTGKA